MTIRRIYGPLLARRCTTGRRRRRQGSSQYNTGSAAQTSERVARENPDWNVLWRAFVAR